MQNIVELKIEETKTVVGGTKVSAPPVATSIHAPISIPDARVSSNLGSTSANLNL
jgi:hypothetical protein